MTICVRSISAWRRYGGTHVTDWRGDNSWRQLCLLDILWRERDHTVLPVTRHKWV